jgi:hypothetical protein
LSLIGLEVLIPLVADWLKSKVKKEKKKKARFESRHAPKSSAF